MRSPVYVGFVIHLGSCKVLIYILVPHHASTLLSQEEEEEEGFQDQKRNESQNREKICPKLNPRRAKIRTNPRNCL